jgi:hypothetical protein
VYGLVTQIQNYIIEINNTAKITSFKVGAFSLNIFDRRFRDNTYTTNDCIRIDSIPLFEYMNSNNLQLNLNNFKIHIYKQYINDIINFKPSKISTTRGILDNLFSNLSSVYYINNNSNTPNNESIQLYNLSISIDNSISRVYFNNYFSNFFYYDTTTNTWIQLSNLLNRNYLYDKNFITEIEYNDPLYIPSLDKDIPEYEIDFNTNKTLENPVKDGLIDIKNLEYPSVGYYMGYRHNMPINKNIFLKSSILNDTNRIIRAEKLFDTSGYNYIFMKINNWGYIDFFGERFMAKILLTQCLGNPKLDACVNQDYIFRQPININKLDIELVDYLGNTLDLNGCDFSCSLQFKQFISSEQKNLSEKHAVVFNKLNNLY